MQLIIIKSSELTATISNLKRDKLIKNSILIKLIKLLTNYGSFEDIAFFL